jgi:molybdopterin-guanine dinucleotide biosynthesis protein A
VTPGAPITGVILAGGRGARWGGVDKGLLPFDGRPLVEYAIERLRPQVSSLFISANRNFERYAGYGVPTLRDEPLPDGEPYAGPLAGMLAALGRAATEYIAVVPCDAPKIAADLVARLDAARRSTGSRACFAHDGRRAQFVFALIPVAARDSLREFLWRGERKVEDWYACIGAAAVDFSDAPDAFCNFNSAADVEAAGGSAR